MNLNNGKYTIRYFYILLDKNDYYIEFLQRILDYTEYESRNIYNLYFCTYNNNANCGKNHWYQSSTCQSMLECPSHKKC